MTPRMILLFGMPRSGTTWLGKIFDSHPDTLYRHEPDSVKRITSVSVLPDTVTDEALEALRTYSDSIPRIRALKVVGKSPVFPKNYLSRAEFLRYRIGVAIARFTGRLGVQMRIPWTPTSGNDDTVIVWKSIESLGRFAVLLEALPEARALHIVRHPCGYVASVEHGEAGGRFGDLSPSSEDFELMETLLETRTGRSWGLSVADIRAMHPEERLAWRWSIFNDMAIEGTQDLPQALSFSYERLCAAPAAVVRSLLEHANLEWEEQVEQFLQSSTSSTDTQYYSVFKDPAVAAWRWQDRLDPSKAQRIVDIASRSITWKKLGYDQISAPDVNK